MSSQRTFTEEITLQQEIERRQDQVLAQLDDLERQIASLMAEFTERLQRGTPVDCDENDDLPSIDNAQNQAA